MKFTSQVIILLFAILIFLGVFLYYLNNLTENQLIEEQIDSSKTNTEGLENKFPKNCPNLLINRGDMIVLLNTQAKYKTASGADTHVIAIFKSLSEYAMYVKEQQLIGNYCPVLYLRQETNAQGKDVYRMYSPPKAQSQSNSNTKPLAVQPQPQPRVNQSAPIAPNTIRSPPVLDLHNQPPFYIEGGLPPIPTEPASKQIINVMDASREDEPFNKDQYPGFDPYGLYVGKFTNLDILHNETQNNGKKCSVNPADPNWCGILETQYAVESGMFAGNEVHRPIYPNAAFV